MEKDATPTAQEQLDALASSHELAVERIVLPWRDVIALAVAMNACLLALVLPIILSDGWTLLIQAAFTAALVVLALKHRQSQSMKRPLFRVHGSWIVTVFAAVGFGLALAVGIYARLHDDPWLGAAALLINTAADLAAFGGIGFLLRRQFARLT